MASIPVAILGATGMVGQRMIERLANHSQFHIAYLGASSRSAGKRYTEACTWRLDVPCPETVKRMTVGDCSVESVPVECHLILSALDSSVAGDIELSHSLAGRYVVSNAGNHRMDSTVPLVIPEVNPAALELLKTQQQSGGIITNPNCCAIPLALSLAPLQELGTIKSCVVSTWQAVSGAGYPGESAWDMVGTVHPHAGNEEDKLAIEPCKILEQDFPISARCVRVPVADGHLLSVQVSIEGNPTPQQAIEAWKRWNEKPSELPSSPRPLFVLHPERSRPSPRLDINHGNGMALSIGRVESCSVMGLKYFVLGHNTIRGAAGAAVANAELLLQRGYLHVNS